MNKIIVTGANGFLGRHIVPLLLNKGFEVHTITKDTQVSHNGVYVHNVNLLDTNAVTILLNDIRPEYFLHLAWETQHDTYLHASSNMEWLSASLHLIRTFSSIGGKRFVSAGTCAEYDLAHGFISESTQEKPSTIYGVSKSSFHNLAQLFFKKENVSFAVGRIFYLYGPYDKDGKVVSYLCRKLLSNESASCNYALDLRDYMYIEDCAEAFVGLLFSSLEGAVNIASGIPIKMADIFTNVANFLQMQDSISLNMQSSSFPCVLADVNRMRNELGFQPQTALIEGLRKTILWHKENI